MTLSVLTCVLGEPESLTQTYDSLKPLLCNAFTWTLKFAANSSAEFINRFEREYVKCHSAEDRSIYQAMNQGLEHMQADHYVVLGAGDEIIPAGLEVLQSALTASPDLSSAFAPIVWRDQGTVWQPVPAEIPVRMSCPHPGTVLRVDHSRALGGFDSSYRIAADYDHICRYVREHGVGPTLSTPLVRFAGGGMSEVRAFEGTLEEELIRMRVWKSHEFAVQSRLLRRIAQLSGSLLDQLAQVHATP